MFDLPETSGMNTNVGTLLVTIGTSLSVGSGSSITSGSTSSDGGFFGKFILVVDQFFFFRSHFDRYSRAG